MSSVYAIGFDIAASNGLTNTNVTYTRGISLDASTTFTWDVSVTTASNPNPYTGNVNAWNRSGSRLAYGSFWGRWTIDGPQTIGSLGVKLENPTSNTNRQFIEITGGQLPSSEQDGTEVTLGHNSSSGKLDVIRPGIAQALLDSIDDVDPYYVLLDGNGNVKDSKQASNSGGTGPKWEWFDGGPKFGIASDLAITNSTGAQYNVEEVQVRLGSPTGITFMKDATISVGVPNNATITFTTLEINLSGLS